MRFASMMAAAGILAAAGAAQAASLSENFNEPGGFFGATGTGNVASVPVVAGWVVKNNSAPTGTSSWYSGSSSSPLFGPFEGTGYAAVDVNSTGSTGTISNWLMTPQVNFNAGDTVTFYTRTASPVQFPDRLQVRLSSNGASTNVGSTSSSLGDFTTLLLEVNPNQIDSGLGAYPTAWTLETVSIPTTGSGRLAFRYFVTDAGPSNANGNYIGVDAVNITAVPEPASLAAVAGILGFLAVRRRHRAG